MPPDERVGAYYEQRSVPVEQPRQQRKTQSGGHIGAARPDASLLIQRELPAQEEDFSLESAGRAKRQDNESQGVRQQLKCNPYQRDHAPIMP